MAFEKSREDSCVKGLAGCTKLFVDSEKMRRHHVLKYKLLPQYTYVSVGDLEK